MAGNYFQFFSYATHELDPLRPKSENQNMSSPQTNSWTDPEKALEYVQKAASIPHRVEGEAALLEFMPQSARRVLDLGSGAGRLLGLVRSVLPRAECVALEFSPAMIEHFHVAFTGERRIQLVKHDMQEPLPALGTFDAIVSSFAIHHLTHDRKRGVYAEVFDLLTPGGVFCNLEHVASPSENLHDARRPDATTRTLGKACGRQVNTQASPSRNHRAHNV